MKKVNKRMLVLVSMVACLMFGGIVVYASTVIWGGEDDIKGIEVVLDKLKLAVQSRDGKLKESAGKLESELSEKEILTESIKSKEQAIGELNEKKTDLEAQIEGLKATIETQKKNLAAKDAYREVEIAEMESYYTGEVKKYQDQVRAEEAEKNAVLEKLNDLIVEKEELDKELTRLTKASNEKDGKLEKARTDVKELREKAESILEEVNTNEND